MKERDEQLRDIITRAVTDTIENMAFMEVLPADQEQRCDAAEEGVVRASLLIHEPNPGELRLEMPVATASGIARVLYGVDDEALTESMVRDVAGELLNTIAGRVMKDILPGECAFKLGIPEIGDDVFLSADRPMVTCTFTADGCLFSIMGCMDLLAAP